MTNIIVLLYFKRRNIGSIIIAMKQLGGIHSETGAIGLPKGVFPSNGAQVVTVRAITFSYLSMILTEIGSSSLRRCKSYQTIGLPGAGTMKNVL
jgi:hypothetical protein